MPKPKGGRGKSAPYSTRQVRIPEPIISQVDELVEHYQNYLEQGGDASNPPKLLAYKKLVDKFEEQRYKAISILEESLLLKANAGGAIKIKIKEVLQLLSAN
jgi:hypothetical protein